MNIIYRNKLRLSIIGLVLMTFILSLKFLNLDNYDRKLSYLYHQNNQFERGLEISNINLNIKKRVPVDKTPEVLKKDDQKKQRLIRIDEKKIVIKKIDDDTVSFAEKEEEHKNKIPSLNGKILFSLNSEKHIIDNSPSNEKLIANNNNNNNYEMVNNILVEKINPQNKIQINNYPANSYIEPINSNNNIVINDDASLKDLDRIVHIDLKGAPPKIDYFERFIPMLKEYGAHGVLLEYEDTFPFEGQLAEARHGNAYSIQDVNRIKELCKKHGLYIMPLVQTYGHLEWVLKLQKFAHLREAQEFPQVITPCLEESYTLIYDILDQVIKQHRDVPYFHIGCDEVYYKLLHPKCGSSQTTQDFTDVFMNHLIKIASYVRKKLPKAKIIFWDDMLHGMDEISLNKYKPSIMNLEIQPMIWGYMEDVRSYFQYDLYVKYGRIFETIWAASAYKGASGELVIQTSIQHHYLNHLSWISVINEKMSRSVVKFKGIALTGWSRYDHFLALCDLLPEAIPSLVFNLQVLQYGRLNNDKKNEITSQLGCTGPIPWFGETITDQIMCNFPGHEIYEVILSLGGILKNMETDLEFANKYMTPLNLDYGYLHKKRALEVMERLTYTYQTLISFKNRFIQACSVMYHDETANEWLTVYFIPHLDKVYNMITKIKKLSDQNYWKPRPLPVTLKQYPEII